MQEEKEVKKIPHKPNITRRDMREGAFLIVFQSEANTLPLIDLIDANREGFGLETTDFMLEIAGGTIKNLEEIDRYITKYSPKRAIERIAKINLAILRIAIFELIYRKDTPSKVAINEALLLCEEYGEIKDKPFLNGLLGGFFRGEIQGNI